MENKQYTELSIQEADIALDAIDALPKKLTALADAVTRSGALQPISFADWNDFIGTIEMACDDLLGKERGRLMAIAGWRPDPKSMYVRSRPSASTEVLNEIFQNIADFNRDGLRVPTNPATTGAA